MKSTANSPLVIYGDTPCHEEPLRELVSQIFEGENVSEEQEVSLIFCSQEMIKKLNYEYRGKDSVTDVLSFPFNDPDFLGEIYICTDRLKEQAQEYNFTYEEEACRLLTHGMFHLLGYDHIDENDRKIMESKEKEYFIINIDSPKE